MSYPQSPPDLAIEDALRLPKLADTLAAEELHVRLVLAADAGEPLHIDGTNVESLGQAVIQLLLAAEQEAHRQAGSFAIQHPSDELVQRLASLGLGRLIAHSAPPEIGE